MKSSQIAFIVLLVLAFGTIILLQSCNNAKLKELLHSRIKGVETTTIGHQSYSIISVDGKEFICSSSGGIYPLK